MVNYWLWVEKEGGIENEMEPDDEFEWEGCHYDTEEEDLILIYRTRPYKRIQYLIKASSDSKLYPKNAVDEIYNCNCEVLYNFKDNSLQLKEMQDNNLLEDWYPLKVNFVKMKFPIEEKFWNILKDLLIEKNPNSENLFE